MSLPLLPDAEKTAIAHHVFHYATHSVVWQIYSCEAQKFSISAKMPARDEAHELHVYCNFFMTREAANEFAYNADVPVELFTIETQTHTDNLVTAPTLRIGNLCTWPSGIHNMRNERCTRCGATDRVEIDSRNTAPRDEMYIADSEGYSNPDGYSNLDDRVEIDSRNTASTETQLRTEISEMQAELLVAHTTVGKIKAALTIAEIKRDIYTVNTAYASLSGDVASHIDEFVQYFNLHR